MPRIEIDDKIESREILKPVHLLARKDLSSSKIFKIFMIDDNVNRITRTFKIVTPCLEGFKDFKELFVMNIIIEFRTREHTEMECNRVNFAIG